MKNIHNRYSIWFFNFFYANHSIHDVALKDFSLKKHHYISSFKIEKEVFIHQVFPQGKKFSATSRICLPKVSSLPFGK